MTGFLILALCVVALWAGSKALNRLQSLIAADSCLAVPRSLFRLILSLD